MWDRSFYLYQYKTRPVLRPVPGLHARHVSRVYHYD